MDEINTKSILGLLSDVLVRRKIIVWADKIDSWENNSYLRKAYNFFAEGYEKTVCEIEGISYRRRGGRDYVIFVLSDNGHKRQMEIEIKDTIHLINA